MGFNIAGLVINNNYDKDINKLSDDLKWGIEIIEEVNFETACSNWTPEGEFRLWFSDKATMIFFPHDWVAEETNSKIADTLNYAYSATAMAFKVDVFQKGNMIRTIMEHEGERRFEDGEPLGLEKENPTADALTFALFDELLGEPFGGIDFADKAYRCKRVEYIKKAEEKPIKEERKEEPLKQETPESLEQKAPEKKWWQFWK